MKQNRWLVVGILCLLTLGCAKNSDQKITTAIRGTLDLRSSPTLWNFDKDGPVDLKGEWAFYWQKFIEPAALQDGKNGPKPNGYLLANISWEGQRLNGKTLPSSGFGTYSLTILASRQAGFVSIKMPRVSTAYKLFVNGTLVAKNGQVAASAADSQAVYIPTISTDFPVEEKMVVVLQVSSFETNSGGPYGAIQMGRNAQLVYQRTSAIVQDIFISGCIFLMGLYHLILFFGHKRERSLLYFSLFCVCICIRTWLVNESPMRYLFPVYTFEIFRIEYATAYFAYLCFAKYFSSLFEGYVNRKFDTLILLLSLALLLPVFFAPATFYPETALWFQFLLLPSMLYWFVVLACAYRTLKRDVLIFSAGFLVLGTAAIHDSLTNQQHINSVYLVQYGVLVFLVSQSVLLSLRFIQAFKQVESLSMQMEGLNQNLVEQNAELVRVGKVREEFLSNVSHEMRTPLTSIIMNLEFLDDSALDKEQHASVVREISEGGRRLNAIIERMILGAELETGKIKLSIKTVALKEIIEEAAENVCRVHANFVCKIEGEPSEISSDAGLLRILFGELLTNAAIFGGSSATLQIETLRDLCIIRVRDSGPGIPPEFLTKIGGKFERVDQSITYEKSGTGLGLYLAGQIIALLGGTIEYKNADTGGLEVRVTLPFQ